MKIAIRVSDLKKSYGDKDVLKGLSFEVREGEIFALLGGNGAGKTTTLECIEGLRRYDAGKIDVTGRMGIQLQSSALPGTIRPKEALALFAKWNGTTPNAAMVARLGIPELGKTAYQHLSTGQKRRLHLALALVSDPDVIFLDEPTAGLDVEGRVSLHDEIRQLRAAGKTVMLASHDMAEVEELCDRIGILHGGRLVFVGSVDELSRQVGKRYNIRVTTDVDGETRVDNLETDDVRDDLLSLLTRYRDEGHEITGLKVDRGTLEQHVMHLLKESAVRARTDR